jgi:hypothetical protein
MIILEDASLLGCYSAPTDSYIRALTFFKLFHKKLKRFKHVSFIGTVLRSSYPILIHCRTYWPKPLLIRESCWHKKWLNFPAFAKIKSMIRTYYRVSIKSFPDYKHLLQENYVEYKHIFFFTILVSKILCHVYISEKKYMFVFHVQ